MKVRYADMFKPKDTRTADELVSDILAGAGIEVI